ncbi:MAG: 50S ribosomal protein L6 [Candidatus Magasanikbacteria bacterium]|nr:50S ribosomal protein L6 [Candidatus Magasanikbacteria bacterium]
MSRIGKRTIDIPAGVTVKIDDGSVEVSGPKGTVLRTVPATVQIKMVDNTLTVGVVDSADRHSRALWGTYGAHLLNMVKGVSVGFKKQLEVNGVGYRVGLQGSQLKLEVGFTHPVLYALPTEVKAAVEKNIITLESANKEILGEVAAQIRAVRKPEPYKGKGIKYVDEVIRRKAGKAAKAAAA